MNKARYYHLRKIWRNDNMNLWDGNDAEAAVFNLLTLMERKPDRLANRAALNDGKWGVLLYAPPKVYDRWMAKLHKPRFINAA